MQMQKPLTQAQPTQTKTEQDLKALEAVLKALGWEVVGKTMYSITFQSPDRQATVVLEWE